jgi:hypothetical protein
MKRSSLIVIENSTHRRAIIEHESAGRIGLGRRRVPRLQITGPVAEELFPSTPFDASMFCRLSTVCSIFLKPRTLLRI